ncbi:MAG: peptidoglycan bridge formation glycyltransferase FemA/FemB family protein [Spirochaetales bacterium]|nr:peptidoglycan bridge formation glycyltransferase FemA/FemB family protein [Spirochaetales bacterium]
MKRPFPHFLQTPQWGLAKQRAIPAWTPFFFVKKAGSAEYAPFELSKDMLSAQFDPEGIDSSILILERSLGMKQKLHYIPRGPWIDWNDSKALNEAISFIRNFANKRKVLFVRMEPDEYEQNFPYPELTKLGFSKTPDYVQANDTVKVPIDKEDEELQQSFHKKHRYNIKLAEKRGMSVRTSTSPEDVIRFYELLKKTESRHAGALHIHPVEYYLSVTKSLAPSGMAKLYLVEKDGVIASSSLVFSCGEEAIYMFGASDYEFRRDMPNHLREWYSMRDARDEGRKFFDLWGVTMRNDPGGGIKRYKLYYYDHVENMAGTFDWTPNKAGYALFKAANKLRRLLG